ncbi:MAG: 1-(5-phosphoribosyl)-5-[(5-phosphoribosylamino)methylideneamino]imidazole-4-carboxamide isomerase [Ruminococcaceae bacterium]|nr:1-(5-phosphoribosyl)-5-[(5-phosphoribosylamino)methylideneamino]imidazole-4-carboxamide isomerase [Oscillospiraceae bacterium]
MQILPAIDIFDKKAVRLYKGDYNQMTVYGTPLEIASEFVKKGATYIHLVDLEGAKKGEPTNFETIAEVIKSVNVPCEIGGGIRNIKTVEDYVNAGADRIILGTSAVSDKAFLKEAIAQFGKKIAVGVDARDGIVSISGWLEQSGIPTLDFIGEMLSMGIETIICTDISKDGALSGTNVELYKEILSKYKLNLIASGGVTSVDDVRELYKCGTYGAILGKAIYNGNIDLTEAIAAGEGKI